MKKEYWKPVVGYEGLYEVSNLGKVKSLDKYDSIGRFIKGKILKVSDNGVGYMFICLSKGNKRQCKYVHRMVAEAFLPNPNNLPQVNHKDENKLNNCVENLEWCTNEYNINYGSRNSIASEKMTNGKNAKTVLQYDLDGNFIKEWVSSKEVERKLGYNSRCLNNHCIGRAKTAYGFIWKYKSDDNT